MKSNEFIPDILIGIDNGVTGALCAIYNSFPVHVILLQETPVKKDKSYTKKPQNIHRIDHIELTKLLSRVKENGSVMAVIERAMVNPHAFKATQSALRALEAMLICLEMLDIPYEYIDSKEWQRKFLSSGITGRDQLKEASKQVGIDIFPNLCSIIEKHGDADSLLIAEYARRKYSTQQ